MENNPDMRSILVVAVLLLVGFSSCNRDPEIKPPTIEGCTLISETHDGVSSQFFYDNTRKLITLKDPTDPSRPNGFLLYNDKGQLIREERHNNNPDWFLYYLYYYNPNGQIDSINYYHASIPYAAMLIWQYEVKYGPSGLPSQIIIRHSSGPNPTTHLFYDIRGNLTTIVDEGGVEHRYEYDNKKSPYHPQLFLHNPTYLSPNNIIREFKTEPGKPEELLLEYEYTYTPEGYPKTKIRHNRKFPQSDILYTYEYECH